MKKLIVCLAALTAFAGVQAQTRSTKRGICWDEKGNHRLTDFALGQMAPGVDWVYTWGTHPEGNVTLLDGGEGLAFAPMAWNGGYDENAMRNYLRTAKGVKYLLGFNEPNFSAQANMTPAQAAEKWPALEAIAREFNLKLVSPALNFTGEQVGGRVWGIYEWLDTFIKEYKDRYGRLPQMDCIALHCYMNWAGANTWFATEYIYKDAYKPENVNKCQNIIEYLGSFQEANGRMPGMMLTEFCAWENDGNINPDFQIDQMTQKVQKLEQSDVVEGYAWFMANANRYTDYPYMGAFTSNASDAVLSTLGEVYVHMSSFDADKYYGDGEAIMAKDYTDASTDDNQVKLRPNTDGGSEAPLQVEMPKDGWAKYQIDVPEDGKATLTFRYKADGDTRIIFETDYATAEPQCAATSEWKSQQVEMDMKAGKQSIHVWNTAGNLYIDELRFNQKESGITAAGQDITTGCTVYDVNGNVVARAADAKTLDLPAGLYIIRNANGVEKRIVR